MRRIVIAALAIIWLGMLLVLWRQWSQLNHAMTPTVRPAHERATQPTDATDAVPEFENKNQDAFEDADGISAHDPSQVTEGELLDLLEVSATSAAQQPLQGEVLNLPPYPSSTRLSGVRRDVDGVMDEVCVYQANATQQQVMAHYLPLIEKMGFVALPQQIAPADADADTAPFTRMFVRSSSAVQSPHQALQTLVLRIAPRGEADVRILLWLR